jgi:ATP-binding cassette subfamily B protein
MGVIAPGTQSRRTLRVILTVVSVAFRADWRGALAMLLLRAVFAVALTFNALWFKVIIDAVQRGDRSLAMTGAVAAAITFGVQLVSGRAGMQVRMGLEERTSFYVDRQLVAVSAGLAGIEHHERPDFLRELELLSETRVPLSQAPSSMFELAALLMRATATVALLAGLHPVMLLLPAFALPTAWTGSKAQQLWLRALETQAENQRRGRQLYDLATSVRAAPEVRIFGLSDVLQDKVSDALDTNDRAVHAARVKGAMLTSAGALVFAAGFGAAIWFMVLRAVRGEATPGEVVLALVLAGQLTSQVAGFVEIITWASLTLGAAGRYAWLLEYAEHERNTSSGRPVRDAPTALLRGLRLEHVTFTYPGETKEALRDVSLNLPAGSTVAIVGHNGAGKSTLVKLLCAFYKPTSGKIVVDDVDLADLDPAAWRSHISASFQDFVNFELRASQTVGIGDLPAIDDDHRVGAALHRAGAEDVFAALPQSGATPLGRSFDNDGVEPSGGQWQKLALSRAMMRLQPLLLVFDEPTASLDAESEARLYRRWADAAGRTAGEVGAVTVLVSHRLSGTRAADLIVVMADGAVVEVGSHEELMRRRGRFAELFEAQAQGYR